MAQQPNHTDTNSDTDNSSGNLSAQSAGPSLNRDNSPSADLQAGLAAMLASMSRNLNPEGTERSREQERDQAREKDREEEKPGFLETVGKALGIDALIEKLPEVAKKALGLQQQQELAKNTPEAAPKGEKDKEEKQGKVNPIPGNEVLLASAAHSAKETTIGKGLDGVTRDIINEIGNGMGKLVSPALHVDDGRSGQLQAGTAGRGQAQEIGGIAMMS